MVRVYLPLICLILATSCNSQALPTFPDIKQFIGNGFMSKVEISGRPENYTVLVDEYYDPTTKITKVVIQNAGETQTIILHPMYKQVAVIENNACKVEKFATAKEVLNPLFTTWLYAEEGSSEVYYGPTSILRRANKPSYVDTSVVRGIDCYRYSANDPDRSDVNIDYFFTADWTTPLNVSKKVQIPVRIVLSGEGIAIEGAPDEDFIQYLDFVYFVPEIKDPRVFELPYGIGCKGLKDDKTPMPSIPKRFTVSGETFNIPDPPVEISVNTFRVWYDYNAKFARMDVYSKDDRGISKVLDYNTGLMYVTRDNQECIAVPISDSYFGEEDSDLRLVMKDPYSAMGIKEGVYYLGKKTQRGILCDVWESVVTNVTVDEAVVDRMVYTYFFSSHWWEVDVEGEPEEQVLIRLEITSYIAVIQDVAPKTVFNFFQFRKHPAMSYNPFRIEHCAGGWEASNRKYVVIIIEAVDDDVRKAEGQAGEFQELVQNEIAVKAKISPIRLPFVRVDYEPTGITIMALILERPPAMSQFVNLGEDVPKSKEKSRGTVKSEELCAEQCIDVQVCVGFHYCKVKGECFISLYDWDDDWGDEVKGPKSCNVYRRNQLGTELEDVLLKDALENLRKAVDEGNFFVEITVENDDKKFQATLFSDEVAPVTGDLDRDMFFPVIMRKKFQSSNKDQVVRSGGKVLSASDCYRKCKNEANVACSSFSFCTDTNECLLSSHLVLVNKDIKDDLDDSPLCNIYSINYLQMFEEYKGQVRILPGKEATSADSASDCARMCREKDVKVCRGFDYCFTKRQCVFHDKHVLDIKDAGSDLTNVGTGCSHYALKFSADFVQLGRLFLLDPKSKSLTAASVESCAKLCSENIEFKCKSFDFCASDDLSKAKCTLNTLSLEDDVQSTSSTACQHYARRDGLAEDYSMQVKAEEPDKSGYSPGGLAGVIIGVLIFGIAVGVIVFIGYSYYRKSRTTDSVGAVRFVNQ